MINNTSCPAKLCKLTLGSRRVARMWSLCSSNITYQHHQIKYLHVFTPNISIRNHRHKHPHYVLMWRRIHFPVNNIFVWGPGSHQTGQPTCRGQWDNFPSFWTSCWVTPGNIRGEVFFLHSCKPSCLLFLPSSLAATPNHGDVEMLMVRWRWSWSTGGGVLLWLGGFWQVM